MEEEAPARVTRLRRRLSVEQNDELNSPATPTKKRATKLAKPLLDNIEENAIVNSPRRATRRSIASEVPDLGEDKVSTPGKRATRAKSNTSIISEASQAVDSPRAKRASRRNSLAGSDNETAAVLTPVRRSRRISKELTRSPDTPVEPKSVTKRVKNVISQEAIAEENDKEVTGFNNSQNSAKTSNNSFQSKETNGMLVNAEETANSENTSPSVRKSPRLGLNKCSISPNSGKEIIIKDTTTAEKINVEPNSSSEPKTPTEKKINKTIPEMKEKIDSINRRSRTKSLTNIDKHLTADSLPLFLSDNESRKVKSQKKPRNVTAPENVSLNGGDFVKSQNDNSKSNTSLKIYENKENEVIVDLNSSAQLQNFVQGSIKKSMNSSRKKSLSISGIDTLDDSVQQNAVIELQSQTKQSRKSSLSLSSCGRKSSDVNGESTAIKIYSTVYMDESDHEITVTDEANFSENIDSKNTSLVNVDSVTLNTPKSESKGTSIKAETSFNKFRINTDDSPRSGKIIKNKSVSLENTVDNSLTKQKVNSPNISKNSNVEVFDTSESVVFGKKSKKKSVSNDDYVDDRSVEPMDIDETMPENICLIDSDSLNENVTLIKETSIDESGHKCNKSKKINLKSPKNTSAINISCKNLKNKSTANSIDAPNDTAYKSSAEHSQELDKTSLASRSTLILSVNNIDKSDNRSRKNSKSETPKSKSFDMDNNKVQFDGKNNSISVIGVTPIRNKNIGVFTSTPVTAQNSISKDKLMTHNKDELSYLSSKSNMHKHAIIDGKTDSSDSDHEEIAQKEYENNKVSTKSNTSKDVTKNTKKYSSESEDEVASKKSTMTSNSKKSAKASLDSSEEESDFLDNEAKDAGKDYQSGDSQDEEEREFAVQNEIRERGETLDSDEDLGSDDSDYEKDSFIVSSDQEDNELLSGSGDDLSLSANELNMSAKSKKQYNERKLKGQKRASREMFEARHSKNNGVESEDSDPDIKITKKNNRNRLRLDSTKDENDKCINTSELKNNRMHLNSSTDTARDDKVIIVNTSKNNKNRLRLDSSMDITMDEREISVLNTSVSNIKDPLATTLIKQEPSSANNSTLEEIENVQVDQDVTIFTTNQSVNPLMSFNHHDASSSESESSNDGVISSNYNSLLRNLNESIEHATQHIKGNSNVNKSLDFVKKDKDEKNNSIIAKLNLTQEKGQSLNINKKSMSNSQSNEVHSKHENDKKKAEVFHIGIDVTHSNKKLSHSFSEVKVPSTCINKKDNSLFDKLNLTTPGKEKRDRKDSKNTKVSNKSVVDSEESSDVIDFKLLFTQDDDSTDKIDTNESVKSATTEENIIPLKKSEAKTNLTENKKGNDNFKSVERDDHNGGGDALQIVHADLVSTSGGKPKKNKKKQLLETSETAEAPKTDETVSDGEIVPITPKNADDISKKGKKNKPRNVIAMTEEIVEDNQIEVLMALNNGKVTHRKDEKKNNHKFEKSVEDNQIKVLISSNSTEETPKKDKKKKKNTQGKTEEMVEENRIEVPMLPKNAKVTPRNDQKKKNNKSEYSVEDAEIEVLMPINLVKTQNKNKNNKQDKTEAMIEDNQIELITPYNNAKVTPKKDRKKIKNNHENKNSKESGKDDHIKVLMPLNNKTSKKDKNRMKDKEDKSEETANTKIFMPQTVEVTSKKSNKIKALKDVPENVESEIHQIPKKMKGGKNYDVGEIKVPKITEHTIVRRLPASLLEQLDKAPETITKTATTSTSDFQVEIVKNRKNKPSQYLEESICINAEPGRTVRDEQLKMLKKPKVMPSVPSASISNAGFTTVFKVNVLKDSKRNDAKQQIQAADFTNFKREHIYGAKVKRVATDELCRQQKRMKYTKF